VCAIGGRVHDADMDAIGMVILAIGSLACLELAAFNLRGEARRPRRTNVTRARR
jgi:lysylphosphatidylglycerol synthetase-like protein (DUF2156 family)